MGGWARFVFFGAAAVLAQSQNASALEGIPPFLAGVSIGVPVGALPPPGLYYSNSDTTFDQQVKNGQGKDIGVHVQDTQVINQFTYVPMIPQILGASYGAFVALSVRASYLGTTSGLQATSFGLVNAVISPINLSWNLGNGFFVGVGLTLYPSDFDYDIHDVIHIGRHYATVEPNFGLTYLNNGWNFTLHPVIDFNGSNPVNDYRSGTLFAMDYTGSRSFGKLKLGVGGTLIEQLSNDTIDGVVVAASPANSYGNRAIRFTVGPVLSYDLDVCTVTAYYNRSVYARNTAGGDNYWLRFDVPLYSAGPARAAKTDAGGTR